MADKDVDEQFAAIMAHWDEDALGLDPYGDPTADEHAVDDAAGASREGTGGDSADLDAELGSDLARLGLDEQGLDDLERLGHDDPSTTPELRPSAPPVTPRDRSGPTRFVTPPAGGLTPPPERRHPAAAGSGWRQHDAPEVEEHFVPPPPQPLPPAEDRHFWLMMVGLIGGPLLFLYLILFNRDGNGWWMVVGISMTIAGFVLLVLRQPLERDEDDDGVRL